MNRLLVIPLLFVIGSLFGFIIEVVYRSFIEKKIINSGFLIGPYVPIYGIGLVLLYLLSFIKINANFFVNNIIIAFVSTLIVTMLEYLTGLLFLKTLKIRLWDYSDRKGNIQGFICPLFMLYWFLIAIIYYLLFRFLVDYIVDFAFEFSSIFYPVGFIIGIMAVDFIMSMSLVYKVREFAGKKKKTILYHYIPSRYNVKKAINKMNKLF